MILSIDVSNSLKRYVCRVSTPYTSREASHLVGHFTFFQFLDRIGHLDVDWIQVACSKLYKLVEEDSMDFFVYVCGFFEVIKGPPTPKISQASQ